MTSPLATALAYAEDRGWRIFPTRLIPQPDGKILKKPAIADWPNVCSRNPDVIRGWWRQWPDAVPSLVTGPRNGILILDVDVGVDKDTGRPFSGFDVLEQVFNWWAAPETPTAHSPRGGSHFYFTCPRAPDDAILNDASPLKAGAIRNSTSKLGKHVDVRGWNGQAVLPSPNSGYWWDPHWNFATVEPIAAPRWFDYRPPKPQQPPKPGNGARSRFDPRAVLAESCRRIRSAPEGTRHDTYRHEVFRCARLVGLGLLDERVARNDLSADVMALGQIADGHTDRVEKYFGDAWSEGLAASRNHARRASR